MACWEQEILSICVFLGNFSDIHAYKTKIFIYVCMMLMSGSNERELTINE